METEPQTIDTDDLTIDQMIAALRAHMVNGGSYHVTIGEVLGHRRPRKSAYPLPTAAPIVRTDRKARSVSEALAWSRGETYTDTSTPTTRSHWEVMGSNGDPYVVTRRNEVYRCTCKGWAYRSTCRHVTDIVEGLKVGANQ